MFATFQVILDNIPGVSVFRRSVAAGLAVLIGIAPLPVEQHPYMAMKLISKTISN
jgi:hypothetical protein